MEKIQFETFKEPYLSAETMNKLQDNIEEAINEKGSGSGIHIGTDEPTDTNVWINPDEPLNAIGTEVVDSLSGNEINKAPSVRTIKEYMSNRNMYSTDETVVGTYDRKTLYRKIIKTKTPTVSTDWTVIANIGTSKQIKSIRGSLANYLTIPCYVDTGYNINFQYNSENGNLYCMVKGYLNSPIELIIEYTKTTDLLEGGETNEI